MGNNETKESVLEKVKGNGMLLKDYDQKFRNDKDIMLAAVKNDVRAIKYIGDGLKNDKDIFFLASRFTFEYPLKYAGDDLLDDREFINRVVMRDGAAIRFASERLKNDSLIAFLAADNDFDSLRFVGEKLKDSNIFVTNAIIRFGGSALQYASERLKDSRKFSLEMIDLFFRLEMKNFWNRNNLIRNKEVFFKAFELGIISSITFCTKELKDSYCIVIEAVKKDENEIYLCSKRLRGNNDIIRTTVKSLQRSGNYFRFFNNSYLDDDLVCKILLIDGRMLQYVRTSQCQKKEICVSAFKQNPRCIKYFPEKVIEQSSFLRELRKHQGNIESALEATSLNHEETEGEFKSDEWKEVFISLLSKEPSKFTSTFFKQTEIDFKSEKQEYEKLKKIFRDIHFSDLVIERFLGGGAFAYAYLCRIENVEGVFVSKFYKSIENEQKRKKDVEKDSLDVSYHPNVCPILGSSFNETIELRKLPDYENFWAKRIRSDVIRNGGMILMKYHRSNLKDFLKDRKKIYFEECFRILEGISLGINHLHDHMIVHRDLHPGNIFLYADMGRVWVGDFGCSIDLRNNKGLEFKVHKENEILFSVNSSYLLSMRKGGESRFSAPEIRNFDPETQEFLDYDVSDIFSAGMIGKYLISHLYGECKKSFEVLVDLMVKEEPKERIVFKALCDYLHNYKDQIKIEI